MLHKIPQTKKSNRLKQTKNKQNNMLEDNNAFEKLAIRKILNQNFDLQ